MHFYSFYLNKSKPNYLKLNTFIYKTSGNVIRLGAKCERLFLYFYSFHSIYGPFKYTKEEGPRGGVQQSVT